MTGGHCWVETWLLFLALWFHVEALPANCPWLRVTSILYDLTGLTVSPTVPSLLHPPPPPEALWCFISFPLAFTLPPISTLRAKLWCSRTFRKGWTLTFCKMSELLLDPGFTVSALWLDSGCVLSSRWAHTQTGGHWSTNRCHGSKEGVDWSLERPHSSTHTPERTPGSHTVSWPFCLSFVSPHDFAKLALSQRIRYHQRLSCLVYFSPEAERGSILTSLLWYRNGHIVTPPPPLCPLRSYLNLSMYVASWYFTCWVEVGGSLGLFVCALMGFLFCEH